MQPKCHLFLFMLLVFCSVSTSRQLVATPDVQDEHAAELPTTVIDRSGLRILEQQREAMRKHAAQEKQRVLERARAHEARLKRLFTWVPRIVIGALALYVIVQSQKDLRYYAGKLLELCRLRTKGGTQQSVVPPRRTGEYADWETDPNDPLSPFMLMNPSPAQLQGIEIPKPPSADPPSSLQQSMQQTIKSSFGSTPLHVPEA
jgi:hypothetical protein